MGLHTAYKYSAIVGYLFNVSWSYLILDIQEKYNTN